MGIIGTIFVGLIVGALARLVMPGALDPNLTRPRDRHLFAEYRVLHEKRNQDAADHQEQRRNHVQHVERDSFSSAEPLRKQRAVYHVYGRDHRNDWREKRDKWSYLWHSMPPPRGRSTGSRPMA